MTRMSERLWCACYLRLDQAYWRLKGWMTKQGEFREKENSK